MNTNITDLDGFFRCTYVRCVANFGFGRVLNLFCIGVEGDTKTNLNRAFWRFLLHNIHTYTWRVFRRVERMGKWAIFCKKGCFLVYKCMLCMLYKSEMIDFAFGLLKLSRHQCTLGGSKMRLLHNVHLENQIGYTDDTDRTDKTDFFGMKGG